MSLKRVFNVLRKWNSTPIERMTFTGEGMMNLPVEIWAEIFTIATIASDSNFDTTVIPLLAPPKTMWEQPRILDDYQYESWRTFEPYSTRRSLTLVCKSWYFMVNPILWSNLRVDLRKPSADLEHLHHALAQNRYLAQQVICIFIRATDKWYNGSPLVPEETVKAQHICLLDKIVPKLTQLRMLSCPTYIAERVSWKIRPDIVMLYDSHSREETEWKWSYCSHFWDSCQTLILTHFYSYYYSPLPGGHAAANGPIFKNLVNLRIRLEHPAPTQYITNMWLLPVLQSLSVTSNGMHHWATLFDRVKSTLENLEIAVDEEDYPFPSLSTITMPRLKALCIRVRAATWEEGATIWWVNYITAPEINHMTVYHTIPNRHEHAFYPLGPYIAECNVPEYIGHIVNTALTCYRTIQVLTFSIGNRWKLDGGAKGTLQDIVTWHDVRRWCSLGITVEASNLEKKVTYRVTQEDVEENL
jgi:F-box-like